jgi:hypothetical protein
VESLNLHPKNAKAIFTQKFNSNVSQKDSENPNRVSKSIAKVNPNCRKFIQKANCPALRLKHPLTPNQYDFLSANPKDSSGMSSFKNNHSKLTVIPCVRRFEIASPERRSSRE